MEFSTVFRFGLSSTAASAIPSITEFSSVAASLVVGFYGGHCNRPVWIAMGTLCCGIGSFLFAIPHFATGLYEYADTTFDNLCHIDSNQTDICKVDFSMQQNNAEYLALFVVCSILFGVGAKPLFILIVTYLDDSIPRAKSPLYIGILQSMRSLGNFVVQIFV